MNEKFEISIIIPNYNCEDYILGCLTSIIRQDFDSYEIIIIDDGSNDNSNRIIDSFIKEHVDISIVYIRQFNQNAAVARNRGLEVARGKYVYFLDSDDELYNEFTLKRIYDEISDFDLIIGNYSIIDENSHAIGAYKWEDDIILDTDNVFKYALLSPVPSNKLYRSSIIKQYNLYFDNVDIGQDLNFYLKYIVLCQNIKMVSFDIYNYRIVHNSMTRLINLKILSIKKSFDHVKSFYRKQNKMEKYDQYISLVELKHYCTQMSKVTSINSKKEKKMLFSYFVYCIDSVGENNILKDHNYYGVKREILIKKLFKYVYLSNYYLKLKKYFINNVIRSCYK